ncbi:MAG: electron transfer flavoprotein-ubiquinone oxidoreductase, partial [Proteobacteria bacterium]|nr:electron transfer flavoprotein-ubiquinone oxidoreductase [Pseudomonadota bacterium]
EEMPVDVLFVGAGPASLAGAIHLMNLIEKHNAAIEAGEKQGEAFDEPMICIVEKGSEVGSHQLSGAVVDPTALEELFGDWKSLNPPIEHYVDDEDVVYLSKDGHTKAPWLPPEMCNHGKPIFSLGRFTKWLAEIAEEKMVNIFPGFAGFEILYEGDTVNGVRTGDKGVDEKGEPKDVFEPGMDLTAPVTIIGEGPRGHLARHLIKRYNLDSDCQPMAYEVGCKEVLELPDGDKERGFAYHSLGYPLDLKTFGGSFLYSMGGDQVCIGLMTALDAKDPHLDTHHQLQLLKSHPYWAEKLKGGKVVKYGAKTVTIGGWASMPKLYAPGAMIIGDSASFMNPMRIKGVHLAMKSGMLAAETAFEAMVSGDNSEGALKSYKTRIDASWVRKEMEPAKNFHSSFNKGLLSGMIKVGYQYLFGSGPKTVAFGPDHTHMAKLADYYGGPAPEPQKLSFDNKYLVDKLTDVYNSGTVHEEKQPCHLRISDPTICTTKCVEEYGNPCTKFCPAQVYNMQKNEQTGELEMQIDFSNCVHCKTCDIRDPYQIITWVPPEGGNGPEFGYL